MRQGLRELGYVEGQNLVIEVRHAEGRFERLPAIAAELVRFKVDVIVATGSEGVQAAKDAAHTVPIVVAYVGDPVARGFAASLAHPGVVGQGWARAESGRGTHSRAGARTDTGSSATGRCA
jgi:putative tryptophan/tyrosine transport system substrate-binding protein